MRKPKKIIFASQDRLSAVEELAPRFFAEVLEMDYGECLITDESDLRDFTEFGNDATPEVERMLDRIETHYLVDVRVIGSTRIVQLLEFLQARGVTG
jgi:hypothetical protein